MSETKEKYCKHCEVNHPATREWFRYTNSVPVQCKIYYKEYKRQYFQNNKEKLLAKSKEYYASNQPKVLSKNKEYRKQHADQIKKHKHEYHLNNTADIKQKKRQTYLKNRESDSYRTKIKEYQDQTKAQKKEYDQAYRKANRDRLRLQKQQYKYNKYHNNLIFRIADLLRGRMYKALVKTLKDTHKSRGSKVLARLGCSINDLMAHLESKFRDGMSWENYGKWHIDHIFPLARFDLTDEDQLNKACHYTNLQPLWASENCSKGAKLDWESHGS